MLLRLIAASDCSDAELSGEVAVVCPAGWSATPAELPFTLDIGGHLETDVSLAIPARAEPGLYPVRAQLRVSGDNEPAAWHQVVEDICIVEVGAGDEADLVYLADEPAEITLAAGDTAR